MDVFTFLLENPINEITKEIIVSERLKDYPFTIKPVLGEQHAEYQKLCTTTEKGKVKLDNKKFNEMLILNHVVTPCFRSEEAMTKAKAPTPAAFLYMSLLAGEIQEVAQQILSLSGFDLDPQEKVDEVKNS